LHAGGHAGTVVLILVLYMLIMYYLSIEGT
jgi:hypothetical protein